MNAEDVDIAGDGIDGGRRPRRAVGRDIAQPEINLLFPDQFAGIGIQADQALLQRLADTAGGEDVDMVAVDDGGRAAADWRFPCEVFTGRRPGGGKVLFRRAAVAVWPPPIDPIGKKGRCYK